MAAARGSRSGRTEPTLMDILDVMKAGQRFSFNNTQANGERCEFLLVRTK